MKRLLAKENVELLAQLAWSKVLLVFDYDGTLSPIVSDREKAGMRERTWRLFQLLCTLYPVAVISGRSRADVLKRVKGARVCEVVGNHGLEPYGDLGKSAREVKRARPLLEWALQGRPGLDFEDKRYSLAVHYRQSKDKRADRLAIEKAVGGLPSPFRIVTGKLVINLVPADAPNKGDALLRLRGDQKASTAFYLGDDVTDEDVFLLDQPGRLLTARVGASRSSAAHYFLRDQKEVDVLLARLCELRRPGKTRGAA